MGTLENRIRDSRIEKGISSSELAHAVGVTSAAVSRWETGQVKNLRMEHLFSIARLLDLNPEWLATGKGIKRFDHTSANMMNKNQSNDDRINNDEQAWLNIYRHLSSDCRENVREALKTWILAGKK